MPKLTAGAIPTLVEGGRLRNPVLQVLGIRQHVQADGSAHPYQLLLSDGAHSQGGMLPDSLSGLVDSGQLARGCVVQLLNYAVIRVPPNKPGGRDRALLWSDLQVVSPPVPVIGSGVRFYQAFGEAGAAERNQGGAEPPGRPNDHGEPLQQQQQQQYGARGMHAHPGSPSTQQQGMGPPTPQAQSVGPKTLGLQARAGANQTGTPLYGRGSHWQGLGAAGSSSQPFSSTPFDTDQISSQPFDSQPSEPPRSQLSHPHSSSSTHPLAAAQQGAYTAAQQGAYAPSAYGPTAPASHPVSHPASAPARQQVLQAAGEFMPIARLSPHSSSRWVIKGRVSQKSEIRRFSNPRGEGRFFTFDLVDAQKGEIRVYAWNSACDQYYDWVEEGECYTLSQASVRAKKGAYNQTRHTYELHLQSTSQLQHCQQDAAIKHAVYTFRPIAELEETPVGAIIDVIGIVQSVGPWSNIQRRDGTATEKRSVTLLDSSQKAPSGHSAAGSSIGLTLWGRFAHNPGDALAKAHEEGQLTVLALKGGRVGDWAGRELSTLGSSKLELNPDLPEAAALRRWFTSGGSEEAPAALTGRGGGGKPGRRICLGEIQEHGLGLVSEGSAGWFEAVAWVGPLGASMAGRSWCYPACPLLREGRPCHKKLIPQGTDSWFCPTCDAQVGGDAEWRYVLSVPLVDHTGDSITWATAFNDAAEDLLGVSASDLRGLELGGDPRFDETVKAASLPLRVFRLKLAEDSFQGEQRLRISITQASLPDFAAESRATLAAIHQLERAEQSQWATSPYASPWQQQEQQQWQQQAAPHLWQPNPQHWPPQQWRPQQQRGQQQGRQGQDPVALRFQDF